MKYGPELTVFLVFLHTMWYVIGQLLYCHENRFPHSFPNSKSHYDTCTCSGSDERIGTWLYPSWTIENLLFSKQKATLPAPEPIVLTGESIEVILLLPIHSRFQYTNDRFFSFAESKMKKHGKTGKHVVRQWFQRGGIGSQTLLPRKG